MDGKRLGAIDAIKIKNGCMDESQVDVKGRESDEEKI